MTDEICTEMWPDFSKENNILQPIRLILQNATDTSPADTYFRSSSLVTQCSSVTVSRDEWGDESLTSPAKRNSITQYHRCFLNRVTTLASDILCLLLHRFDLLC